MNRFRVASLIIVMATLAFIALTAYCYSMAVVNAPEEPKPFFKDGIWYDPSLEAYENYSRALRALKPYRLFLQYSPIGFIVLSASWLLLRSLWMKKEKKQGDTHTNFNSSH